MALPVQLESPASFWRSEGWRPSVQLRPAEFPQVYSYDVQLVFGVFQYPIAALLSSERIWSSITTFQAKSFLVSMLLIVLWSIYHRPMNNHGVDASSRCGISWIRSNFQREFYFHQLSIKTFSLPDSFLMTSRCQCIVTELEMMTLSVHTCCGGD